MKHGWFEEKAGRCFCLVPSLSRRAKQGGGKGGEGDALCFAMLCCAGVWVCYVCACRVNDDGVSIRNNNNSVMYVLHVCVCGANKEHTRGR
jgi:hypothetical protein